MAVPGYFSIVKAWFALLLLGLPFCAEAQSPYWSQWAPQGSSSGGFTLVASVHAVSLPGGNIGTLAVEADTLLHWMVYDSTGNRLEAWKSLKLPQPMNLLESVELSLDGSKVIFIGSGTAVFPTYVVFNVSIGQIDLATHELQIAYDTPAAYYMASIGFAQVPMGVMTYINFNGKIRASLYDHDMGIVWRREYMDANTDTLVASLNPNAAVAVDSTMLVFATLGVEHSFFRITQHGQVMSRIRYLGAVATGFNLGELNKASDGNILATGKRADAGVLMKLNPDGSEIWGRQAVGIAYYGSFNGAVEGPHGEILTLVSPYLFYGYTGKGFLLVDSSLNLISAKSMPDTSGIYVRSLPFFDRTGVTLAGHQIFGSGLRAYNVEHIGVDMEGGCEPVLGPLPIWAPYDMGTPTSLPADSTLNWPVSTATIPFNSTLVPFSPALPTRCDGVVSAGERAEPRLTVNPNPVMAEGEVQVVWEGQGPFLLEVFSPTGQLLSRKECKSSPMRVPLQGLPQGIILFRLTDAAGKSAVRRVVVQ